MMALVATLHTPMTGTVHLAKPDGSAACGTDGFFDPATLDDIDAVSCRRCLAVIQRQTDAGVLCDWLRYIGEHADEAKPGDVRFWVEGALNGEQVPS